jgi:hypothetical protein
VTTLIGFTGSNICSVDTMSDCIQSTLVQASFGAPFSLLQSGSVTAASDVPSVPEPATLILFGSRLLGMAARWRTRAADADRSW